jgi:V/A-type H+-transporting ATPase subunit I
MAVEKVKKVAIFGMGDRKDRAIQELQKTGILHIISTKKEEEKKSESRVGELTTAVHKTELILDILEKKVSESFFQRMKPKYVEEEEFFQQQEKALDKNLAMVEDIWQDIQDKNDNRTLLKEEEAYLQELKPWKELDITLSELREDGYTRTILGKLPLRFYEEAVSTVFQGEVHVDLLYSDIDTAYVSVVLLKENHDLFMESVKNYGFEEYFPATECESIREEYQRVQEKIEELRNRVLSLEKSIDSYAGRLREIRLFYDFLQNYKEKLEAETQSEETEYTFAVYAWIAARDIPKLERLLQKIGYLDYEEAERKEGEVAPVYLQNSDFAEPFEFVTDMYSYPGEKEPDPTPFMAPFFALFLAVCLTDAGYGLILVLMSTFSLKKFKLAESMRKLMKILKLSGYMTIVVGILTGGIFGISAKVLGENNVIVKFIENVRLFDPSQGPGLKLFLALSLGLGYVHVLLGFFISFFHKIKMGAKKEAVLDVLPWILIMIGAGGILQIAFPPGELGLLGKAGIGLASVGALIVLLFAGRESKNPIIRFFNGLYGLYDVTGVFGDILSYARLFALGLSTGIIGGVVNEISSTMIQSLSFSGGFMAILGSIGSILGFLAILVIGHIFNLLISALGAFIHTMRLQFVEFFTKFFEGGGEAFTPFKVRSKYFLIKNKKQTSLQEEK